MVKVRCTEYTNCPLNYDDGQDHDIASLEGFACPLKEQAGICGVKKVQAVSIWSKITAPVANLPTGVKLGAAAVVGVGLLGAGAWASSGMVGELFNQCEIVEANALVNGSAKLAELENAGTDCLEAGISTGDVEKLVTGTVVLRTASDRKSPEAAWQLGRLFDPLMRQKLEEGAEIPSLLPAANARTALEFYDKAGTMHEEAAAAAASLRRKYPELALSANGRGGQPLQIAGHPGLFQRVLTKPGAVMYAQPSATGGGTALAPLSIRYVFQTKPGWARIGESLVTGPQGWVRADGLESWNVMLVMQYTPPDARNPVLFFRDELAIKALLTSPKAADEIAQMRSSAETMTPDPRLVAIEDQAINWAASPYLMPILRTSSTVTDSGRTTYLAEVASVSGTSGGTGAAGAGARPPVGGVAGGNGQCLGGSAQTAVHQVVFVIDTTASMGPYIDGVRRIAERWSGEIARRGITDKVRFGVVAYRNNMADEPQRSGLEYVTRTVLPLTPESDAAAFATSMNALSPARVSTHSFDEDAVAGLDQALTMNWGQGCGARFMFLVTDAGALPSDDPKASLPGKGLATIAASARDMGVEIFPVHVLTREARSARNTDKAATQYRSQLTDGRGKQLYRSVADGSAKAFQDYLDQVNSFVDAFDKESRGQYLKRADFAKTPTDASQLSVEQLVLGKIFAVQQRFLGVAAGATAPSFTSSWTSDRDLLNPDLVALQVNVLLTRRELGQLAEKCQMLIENARQAKTESSRFFERLRTISAATAQDPKRFANSAGDLGAFMPSFLALLPYKSEVLSLSAMDWRGMGASKQDAFVRRLREKLSYYRTVEADQTRWRQLSGTDAAEQVAQIPLSEMP